MVNGLTIPRGTRESTEFCEKWLSKHVTSVMLYRVLSPQDKGDGRQWHLMFFLCSSCGSRTSLLPLNDRSEEFEDRWLRTSERKRG